MSTYNDPAAHAPDAAALDKGKGKAADDTHDDVVMGQDEESSEEESGPEDLNVDDDEEEDQDNLEPISPSNIIEGGRRTRGKNIDFAEVAEKAKAAGDDPMDDDDDDDEDFEAEREGDDDMRD